MKAIEILKEFEDVITSSVEDGKYGNATFCFNYRFLEAIEELENLQNENKTLVKTLEKYNEEMIDLRKENQDLKNSNNELLKGLKSTQKRLEEWLEKCK